MATKLLSTPDEEWDIVIRPQRAWWDLRLGELWHYRFLIRLMVWRDFVAIYKQTILGPLWHLIQPVTTTLVFTVIFGGIAALSTDGLPPFLFYMAGNTVWGYFSACLIGTSNTFTNNAGLFGKVHFPRLSVPISVVFSNLITFIIRLLMFCGFWAYFLVRGTNIHLTLWIALLPILILLMAGLGLGFGIIISSLTTKYRDLQQLVSFGTQLLMYTLPIIYPLSSVPQKWRWLVLANPLTPVVEVFRLGFLGTSTLEPVLLLYSFIFTLSVLLIGIFIFNHVENTFMDTV